ncbi:MAG: isochorismatase family protein [Planctomycetaceae bacterium]
MENTDQSAEQSLAAAMQSIDTFYRERGIFQQEFGFGKRPAIVVVDFANGWTDDTYAGGSRRLNGPVDQTRKLLETARPLQIPIIYTTSPWRPGSGDQPFKSAAEAAEGFRPWDEHACRIDERLAPQPEDYIIEKENASAFSGTHLCGYLLEHAVDTVLMTGCSTSACIRATATDAKSLRFRPVIIRECVGDRVAAAHVFTLFDIQSRFADVRSIDDVTVWLSGLGTEN